MEEVREVAGDARVGKGAEREGGDEFGEGLGGVGVGWLDDGAGRDASEALEQPCPECGGGAEGVDVSPAAGTAESGKINRAAGGAEEFLSRGVEAHASKGCGAVGEITFLSPDGF
jgi:hypothetical protein